MQARCQAVPAAESGRRKSYSISDLAFSKGVQTRGGARSSTSRFGFRRRHFEGAYVAKQRGVSHSRTSTIGKPFEAA